MKTRKHKIEVIIDDVCVVKGETRDKKYSTCGVCLWGSCL